MAYNPALYNPYGFQQQQLQPNFQFQPGNPFAQQPSNGLNFIDSIDGANMYFLGPNSVSPALFLRDESAFIVKTTDGDGKATLRKYSYKEEPIQGNEESPFVTREYFDQQIKSVMEAINGKHPSAEHAPATATGQFAPQSAAADPVAGTF